MCQTSTMFAYLTSFLLLAAVSASPTGRTDVVFPSLETLRSGVKVINFRALDRDIQLRLEPAGDVISDNFAILNENHEKKNSVDVEGLKRKLYRDKESGAALIINEDGQLSIKGIVNADLRIEPFESTKMSRDNILAHRIIEVAKDDTRLVKDAIIPKEEWDFSQEVVKSREDEECIVIQYLFVTESNFTARFKNDAELRDYLALMITGVQNLMDSLGMELRVELIGITTFGKESEPSFIEDSAISGSEQYLNTDLLLENMGKYYCQNTKLKYVKQADIVMLISRRQMGDPRPTGGADLNAVGVAFMGGVCQKCKKVGVALDDSDYNERVDTVAHESAHLIGSPHDGEGPEYGIPGSPGSKKCPSTDGYIMGDDKGKNRFSFSPCSIENIDYYLTHSTTPSCIFEDCDD